MENNKPVNKLINSLYGLEEGMVCIVSGCQLILESVLMYEKMKPSVSITGIYLQESNKFSVGFSTLKDKEKFKINHEIKLHSFSTNPILGS